MVFVQEMQCVKAQPQGLVDVIERVTRLFQDV